MTVRKRGEHWHFDFQIDGVRYREAIPEAKNKAQAREAEAKVRAAVLENRFEKREKTPTFGEFVETFLDWARVNKRSWRDDEKRSASLIQEFGKLRLNQISQFSIERYKRERLETKTSRDTDRKPATVNRELQLLSKILSIAAQRGLINKNPCRFVKLLAENNERNRFLTTEEEQRLFEVLKDERFDRLRPVVVVALQTGMRKGELLKLEWRDVDFDRKLIGVRGEISKSGYGRFVPMSETAFLTLLDLSLAKKSPKVFGLNCINRAWYDAKEQAKLENFRFHDLRHTLATRLDEAGADRFLIADILGHRCLKTTERYIHAKHERKREFLEKLKPSVTNLSQTA